MKNVLFLSLTLVVTAHFAGAQSPDYTGDVKDVRIIRSVEQHPGASLLWEPYIAEWKPKHLVVDFGAGIPGKVDMGDILASVSTNDGDTWSEPVLIFDHNQRFGAMQFAYANAVLYKPPGEDVMWCFAMRCPMNYRDSEDSQLAAAYSADGGLSWTPVELAMHYTGPLIIVAGIQRIVENGQPRYLLPAHSNTRRRDPIGGHDQFILSSTSLLEWRLAGHIPQPETGRVFLHEGNLAPGDAPGEVEAGDADGQLGGERPARSSARIFQREQGWRSHLDPSSTGTRPVELACKSLLRPKRQWHPPLRLQRRPRDVGEWRQDGSPLQAPTDARRTMECRKDIL